jgi:hypothetical protein
MHMLATYKGKQSPVCLMNPTFKVGGYGEDIIVGTTAYGNDFSIIKVGGEYVFHSSEGPAFSYNPIGGERIHMFIVNGEWSQIQDMPIDPTLMFFLTLKYTPRREGSMFYV